MRGEVVDALGVVARQSVLYNPQWTLVHYRCTRVSTFHAARAYEVEVGDSDVEPGGVRRVPVPQQRRQEHPVLDEVHAPGRGTVGPRIRGGQGVGHPGSATPAAPASARETTGVHRNN